MKQKIILALICLVFASLSPAADLRGRMGVGASNQLANDLPAISFKIQQSKTFAVGGLLGFRSDENHSLYGAGIKLYRIIFDEPQLNFYLAGLFAANSYVDKEDKAQSGYQVDGTLGTEFHFSGLESIGFSFEFGMSARNADQNGSTFQTMADHLVKAAVHFYL